MRCCAPDTSSAKLGGIPLAMPRSSSSVSYQRRATSAHGQGDLWITVRASPPSVSPRASHSSSTSNHLVVLDEFAGSSDRAGPSISFEASVVSLDVLPSSRPFQPHSTSLSRKCSVDAELPGVYAPVACRNSPTISSFGVRNI